ncbi:YbdD/YjiX family protein [Devriesea agamarum]|uniref:YbdD/YjiX family protein n=1 Tax=Devriesea agamarum TaxID=472569 RepID=UPI002F9125B0
MSRTEFSPSGSDAGRRGIGAASSDLRSDGAAGLEADATCHEVSAHHCGPDTGRQDKGAVHLKARPRSELTSYIGSAWKAFRRFSRGVLGSDAYDKYLTHHRVSGCPHPPLSEREFWRQTYRDMDENPRGRCC